ncbi:creC [Gossypium arboreum]|uniref:CreC n=1 Tax=Gossypium arboreum TaxID=29729 RepID=A0A0B0PCW0_GOSAR|nr:creC [Gossypium arboreum]
MINKANGMISIPSSSANAQSPGLKTYLKTPEGRYKLHYEKTYPSGLLHYSHGKTVTQVTLAHLKEKPAPSTPTASSSSFTASSGVKSAAARWLGAGNGSRALSFVGGNGSSKSASSAGRIGSLGSSSPSNSMTNTNFDGKGTYLIFNVSDSIFISDLNSQDKDPIKSIHFSNSNPVCHAFDQDAKNGHDLLIGLNSGDVTVPVLHGSPEVMVLLWEFNLQNFMMFYANKDCAGDSSFPVIKDQTQFSVAHARHSKSNPIARWHVCQGSINSIAFSSDGACLATVGRDGYLRVFDYSKEQLVCGGKSYYGALLCCAWSGVAFDSYWSSPNSDGTGETVMYRFGSVGQDTQLLLWDLEMDEIVVPLRRCPPGGSPTYSSGYPPGGSPTFSTGSQSSHWDNVCPLGTLQPAPSIRDVPKISPLVAHRVHTEPLSGLIFTPESVLTVCRQGHIKVWMRPSGAESQSSNSETVSSSKDKPLVSNTLGSTSHKQ